MTSRIINAEWTLLKSYVNSAKNNLTRCEISNALIDIESILICMDILEDNVQADEPLENFVHKLANPQFNLELRCLSCHDLLEPHQTLFCDGCSDKLERE